jgi:hypothetical protein
MSFAGPDIRSVTSVRTSSTNLLRKKFRSRAARRRATRIRTYAQSVRLIDRVVRGVMAWRTASSSGSSLHLLSPSFPGAIVLRAPAPLALV